MPVGPQEKVLRGLPGVSRIVSKAQRGQGEVSIEFLIGHDLRRGLIEVLNRLDRVPRYSYRLRLERRLALGDAPGPRSRAGASVGASHAGRAPGPVALSAHNADDLHRTNVRPKHDERWPDGPERIRRRSDVLSGVSRIGVLGEESEGAVKRFEHFIRNVERVYSVR